MGMFPQQGDLLTLGNMYTIKTSFLEGRQAVPLSLLPPILLGLQQYPMYLSFVMPRRKQHRNLINLNSDLANSITLASHSPLYRALGSQRCSEDSVGER